MVVSVVPCRSYDRDECAAALDTLLRPLGGLDWVTPGLRVAIKVNLVSGMNPERAATTHPMLLAVLTEMLRSRGATVVIGDSPGGLFTPGALQRVYRAAGLFACESAGAELNLDCSQADAQFPEGISAKSFQYTAWLKKTDAIINFCKLKTHGMMGMSAAAKNLFGTIPGTMKPEYHYKYPNSKAFANMLVDLDEYFKPVLNIVDGVVCMEGNGPTAGTPRKIGVLVASQSPHAADLLCSELIGIPSHEIPTLTAAMQRGLIPENLSELCIVGDYLPYKVPDFQKVVSHRSLLWKDRLPGFLGLLQSRLIGKLLETKPVLKPSECIGCKKCCSICPAKAISMKNDRPEIDRSKCIKCFCCQEFCPRGALKAQRSLIARTLNGQTSR